MGFGVVQFHALRPLVLPGGQQSAGAALPAPAEPRGWGGSRCALPPTASWVAGPVGWLTWRCGWVPPGSSRVLPEHALLADGHREEPGGRNRGAVHQCRCGVCLSRFRLLLTPSCFELSFCFYHPPSIHIPTLYECLFCLPIHPSIIILLATRYGVETSSLQDDDGDDDPFACFK